MSLALEKPALSPQIAGTKTGAVELFSRALVGHQHSVDDLDDAIGLKYVGNSDHGGIAFFVFQHEVFAIM